MGHGREHCANHSDCLICSLIVASKSDTDGDALVDLVFLFFRDLTVVKSEYMNVEESSVVGMPDIRFASNRSAGFPYIPSACYPNNTQCPSP